MSDATTSFCIAIPTHDRRETVLLAVRSALQQQRAAQEVLVLCDGCTDGTAEAVAALGNPRVRAIELPKGPGYAYDHRNVAVRESEADVLIWLADDDLLLPDHLKRIGRVWDRGDVDIVVAPAVIVHEDDRLEWVGRDWRVPAHRRAMMEVTNTSVMASISVRRSVVADVGGWDGGLERAADWDLWKRVLAQGARPAMVDDVTVLHFRATTRRQAWSLRVLQNATWSAQLEDRAFVRGLRDRTRHARSVWEGQLTTELAEARDLLETMHAQLTEEVGAAGIRQGRLEEAEAAVSAAQHEMSALHLQLADLRVQVVELGAQANHLADELSRAGDERSALESAMVHAARDRDTLERIYAGGWWRLRGWVHAVLAPAKHAKRLLNR